MTEATMRSVPRKLFLEFHLRKAGKDFPVDPGKGPLSFQKNADALHLGEAEGGLQVRHAVVVPHFRVVISL